MMNEKQVFVSILNTQVIYRINTIYHIPMMSPQLWSVKRHSEANAKVEPRVERYIVLEESTASVNIIEDEIDDVDTRRMLWLGVFGHDKVPQREHDAVDKYAGSLSKILPNISREEIEDAIREAKEKYE